MVVQTCQRDGEDHTSTKKPRVVWSVEMHQQFVNAVNSLGIDSETPITLNRALKSGFITVGLFVEMSTCA